jgi:hypothetical protein
LLEYFQGKKPLDQMEIKMDLSGSGCGDVNSIQDRLKWHIITVTENEPSHYTKNREFVEKDKAYQHFKLHCVCHSLTPASAGSKGI